MTPSTERSQSAQSLAVPEIDEQGGEALANPIEPLKPVARSASEESDPYAARDLIAQQDMAAASVVMAIAACLTLLVTFAGTILIWRQVRLTRRAVEETTKTTAIVAKQNELASEAQRAWIDLIPNFEIGMHPSGKISLSATTTVKNIGKTLATKVRYTSRFCTGDPSEIHKQSNEHFRRLIDSDGGFSLMPGKEISGGQTFGAMGQDSIDWDEHGKAAFCIISIAVYEIQGEPKRRYSRALWRATRDGNGIGQGDIMLTWEDITSGEIVMGKHDWLTTI